MLINCYEIVKRTTQITEMFVLKLRLAGLSLYKGHQRHFQDAQQVVLLLHNFKYMAREVIHTIHFVLITTEVLCTV